MKLSIIDDSLNLVQAYIGAGGPSWRESLELADTHSVTDTLDVITELV